MSNHSCRTLKRTVLFLVGFLAVAALVITGCVRPGQETSSSRAAQAAPQEAPAAVTEPSPTPAAVTAQLVSNSAAAITLPADVEAAREVGVVFPVPGRVQEVHARVGDPVAVGQVLAMLDHRSLDAQVAQVEAALKVANAQLALLQEPPDEADLAAARAAVDAAEKGYNRMLAGPTEEDLIQARAAVAQAEAGLKQAQAAYDQIAGLPNAGLMPQALGLEQATIGYQTAKATYDKIAKGATEDQIAAAYSGLLQARSGLKKLLDGPKPAQLAVAAAQILQAQSALDAMKVQRDNAFLRAPMNGVISARRVITGAYAGPGMPAFTIISTRAKVVFDADETVARSIQIGQDVEIQLSSIPDKTFKGRVVRVAPTVDTQTRTQRVTIAPLEGAAIFRPGMFATVSFRQEG